MSRQVYFGSFFHCLSFNESESVLNGFIAVEDGKVICKYAHTKQIKKFCQLDRGSGKEGEI